MEGEGGVEGESGSEGRDLGKAEWEREGGWEGGREGREAGRAGDGGRQRGVGEGRVEPPSGTQLQSRGQPCRDL